MLGSFEQILSKNGMDAETHPIRHAMNLEFIISKWAKDDLSHDDIRFEHAIIVSLHDCFR